jgi:hypothetical protein
MCLFSGPVLSVSSTKIFARISGRHQFLVYEMTFSADEELAMVLPIPVLDGSGEAAVEFMNLEGYPDLFKDLKRLFPVPTSSRAASAPATLFLASGMLEVHDVGAFEASFVPTLPDFGRLDPRFQMDDAVWDALPMYRDYGFCVFKLKAGRGKHAHPMAFSFPTRDPAKLFFPTVHVHDGQVPAEATFDHVLYAQLAQPDLYDYSNPQFAGWWGPSANASTEVSVDRTLGIVDGEKPCVKKTLVGSHDNRDQWL